MENHQIPFTKMQGTGNDFIVLDLRNLEWDEKMLQKWTPKMCNRRYGIGADGILALDHSKQTSYKMIYKNADGSDAGMCGNGGRCLALYATERGFPTKHQFQVHDKLYQADVEAEHVQLQFPAETDVQELSSSQIDGYQVDPGTEHIVLPVASSTLAKTRELRERGEELRHHSLFQPVGTNVNFLHGKSEQILNIKTYERGVEDLTPACGTGAIASALAWHYMQNEGSGSYTYHVEVEGGTLQVGFTYDQATDTYTKLKLGGPAHFVFEGKFYV